MQAVLKSYFQFDINSKTSAQGYVYILGSKSDKLRKTEIKKITEKHQSKVESKIELNSEKRSHYFLSSSGPVWILQNFDVKKGMHQGLLDESEYSWFREQSGGLVSQFKTHELEKIEFNLSEVTETQVRACIVGLELAAYSFLNNYNKIKVKTTSINFVTPKSKKSFKLDLNFLKNSLVEASSTQLARHLVNLPPNILNPETVEAMVKNDLEFSKIKNKKTLQIEIWNQKKLASENMNLHLAVGKGSEFPPRMIHIKYRPQTSLKKSKKPLAFVGKGITFDTGGLDIKPSSGMRLMKKDMGGAAAVIGLAYWVVHSNYERACDFYLALAENSVDAKAMRPSDLYRSRAGYLVEIDNTDAEGRLVLADVMDVAATQKGNDEPEVIIDLATLTGAIKVALGADVSGLFSNDDQLANQLQKAGQSVGELSWRMPLIPKYFSGMNSHFADFKNSADGFGGAITAALFLEKFCRGKKWAHLDIYSWNDKPSGALSSIGGNGQPVQSMIEWMKGQV